MKKLFTLLVFTLFVSSALFAQDKKMKFGLKIAPYLNSYKSESEKDITSNGAKGSFMWGGAAELNLGDNAAIVLGVDVAYSGGKINYLDSVGYALYDDEIVEVNSDGSVKEPLDSLALTKTSFYHMNSRSVKANYVNLPFHLKFKTNEIGYLTYFGQFGLNTMINTNALAEDDSNLLNSPTVTSVPTDIDVSKEVQPITFALHIQLGAEYNLSGSTSLVVGLFYNNGFSNVLKKTSSHLVEDNASLTQLPAYQQKVYDRSFGLAIGIMF